MRSGLHCLRVILLPGLLAGLVGLGITGATAADGWPTKPILIVVGNPAGGPADTIARLVTGGMAKTLGQPFIVEARPGGGTGGTIAMNAVFSAAPDGYTIGLGTSGPLGAGPALVKLPWDPPKDFTAISQISEGTFLLGVSTSLGVDTVQELIAKVRVNPGRYNYGSDGIGSSTHLGFELFKIRAGGLDVVHIPYKGSSEKNASMLAGEIHLFLNSPSKVVDGMIADGKIKAVAVTSPRRLADLPNVPTMEEAGLPGVDARSWFGLVAPKGLPADIVERLNQAAVAALQQPEVIAGLKTLGQNAHPGTPAELTQLMTDANRQWREVVEKANIKVDN